VSILLSKHTHIARILDKNKKSASTVEVTPLSVAIAKGNFSVAKLLINNGAGVTKYDNINITP
ncbi:MAG: hypothetical protein V2J13_11035, partial [Cycloclasticus sp.]|nr:hypothetical protein [Cycloclasticus sp.]